MRNIPESIEKEFKESAKGLNLSQLLQFHEGQEVSDPELEEQSKGMMVRQAIISRHNFELGLYPPKAIMLDFLRQNWSVKSKHIYTKDLNVGGKFVKDTFEKYLGETSVQLDEDGQIKKDENGRIIGYFQSSDLKKANRTPRHLFFALNGLLPKKDKEHFQLGEALHACILEPTRFSRYVVEPKANKASHDGCNALWKFWEEKLHESLMSRENPSKYSTKHKDMVEYYQGVLGEPFRYGQNTPLEASEKIVKLLGFIKTGLDYNEAKPLLDHKKTIIETFEILSGVESVTEHQFMIIKVLELNFRTYGNGIIKKLVTHAKRECSAYLDDYDGLPLKVRPDALQFRENIGVDAIISVKSTSAQDIGKFFYDCAKYDYDISDGMYMEVLSKVTGREFRSVITIMFQTVEPYGVAVFWHRPEYLDLGRQRFLQAHDITKNTIELGQWTGYDMYAEQDDFGVIDFEEPWWIYKKLEETNQEGLGFVRSSSMDTEV